MDSEVSDFWLRIDAELTYRGIDRKVFAKDIGIMPNTISSGISRHSRPDVEIALKSSKYLKLPLDYLLYGKTDSKKSDKPDDSYKIVHNREILAVSHKLELLPETARIPIINMINEISKNYENAARDQNLKENQSENSH